MAIELHVFLEKSRVPTHDSWQGEIDRAGFPAIIHSPFNPQQDSGFRPASYAGQSTGFEFNLDLSKDIVASYLHIAPRIGNRDMCATFRWSGDVTEMSAALAAAASLTKLTDGIYYYPDDDILFGADDVLQATRTDLGLP